MRTAEVAVIGGTGFYSFLDDAEEIDVQTPYGAPSAPVSVGTVAGRQVAFLPRHGRQHQHPPHAIPYRANLWALRSLGVRQVLAPCAVGGLSDAVAPGDVVVPDQLVDRTYRRIPSYVESGAIHLPFADPYCPGVSAAVARRRSHRAGRGSDGRHRGAAVLDPRRVAAVRRGRRDADQHDRCAGGGARPRAAALLRLDRPGDRHGRRGRERAGRRPRGGVARFRENLERLTGLLSAAVAGLPDPAGCSCSTWADGVALTYDVP